MQTQPGVALAALNRFYEAEEAYVQSDRSDFSAVAETLHPEIVLYQPESLPYGGEWRGHAGFEAWMKMFADCWSSVTPTDPVFYEPDDSTLISAVTMDATARASGRRVQMPICQIIRLRNGLPVEWRNFAWDTVRLLEALGSERPVRF